MNTNSDKQLPAKSIAKNETNSFTAKVSHDPARVRSRTNLGHCLLNIAPKSAVLDKALGAVSIFTGTALTFVMIGGMVCLIPSMILAKVLKWPSFVKRSGDGNNLSTSTTGSVTAIKCLMARSQWFQFGTGGPDYLAPLLLNHLSLLGDNILGSQVFSKFILLLERWNYNITGRVFQDQLSQMSIAFKFGVMAYLQIRTCWIDDCVEAFVLSNKTRDVNFVVLGAGYDTRCYRLDVLQENRVHTYEVDAPGTQSAKLRTLQKAGIKTGSTKFVSCDFERDDWLKRLQDNGFDSNLPTLFVWEGVTMYITRDTVKETLVKVASCGKGSWIGFDYLDRTWALSPAMVRATERGGEPWIFGMTGEEPNELIDECNNSGGAHELKVMDHLKAQELKDRYLPKHYDGRSVGFVEDFGGFLLLGST